MNDVNVKILSTYHSQILLCL